MAASRSDRIKSEASPSQSDCSSSQRRRYDVFLCFRGEDTRRKFTDYLYHGLRDAGVNTFRDDTCVARGEDIPSTLIRAIRSSKISVIVFSRNFADSRWCLQELAQIMGCRKSLRQMVLPIFYDVDPSDVRNQGGSFANAFAKHEKRYMSEEGKAALEQWRAALTEAASLSGWDLKTVADGHEAKIVKEVVLKVSSELKYEHLNVAKYPIGLYSHLEGLHERLDIGSDVVRYVGICGIGGAGKTMLAKAVYNHLFHLFEAKCFLADVRENSQQPNGFLHLQEQLLSDILKSEEVKVGNVHRGVNVIKERLCSRRVLLVLDDLSRLHQLRTLAGGTEWFGPGSRIIITTRNLDLLKEVKADVHMVHGLGEDESLELFSLHVFGDHHPKEEFVGLSRAIAGYSNGLPLALEVLGSFLRDLSPAEWESALEKLKMIPDSGIQAQLRISYDALGHDTEKSLFLDIACFFVGWDKDYAVRILNGCGLFAEIGLRVLTERCLLETDGYNRLAMHGLLRDMGRDIVREESPSDPGLRSRLWFSDDALTLLRNKQGTEKVEGIILDLPATGGLRIRAEAFSRMTRLRLLQLNHVTVVGDYGVISKQLRWVCWHNFPSSFIPKDFYMGNLVTLDMQKSKLRVAWRDSEVLGNLKVLNLSHSPLLSKTPNFSKLPNLEELILEGCVGLMEVHQSVGYLQRLVLLNLKDCRELKNIPGGICRVKSLRKLNISGCSKINKLPEDIGEMISLREFLADGTSIAQIPLSITHLKNLTDLSLCGCKVNKAENPTGLSSMFSLIRSWVSARSSAPPKYESNMLVSSVFGLTSLQTLKLSGCNLSDDDIPVGIGSLPFLTELDLSKNYLSQLPDSISHLPALQTLRLNDCVMLKVLPELPPSLVQLIAKNCTSLEQILSVSNATILVLDNCSRLSEISASGNWKTPSSIKLRFTPVLRLQGCKSLSTKFKEFVVEDLLLRKEQAESWFPGSEIPDWFGYQKEGPSLSFTLPPTVMRKLRGSVTLCVVHESKTNAYTSYQRSITLELYVRAGKRNLGYWGTCCWDILVTPKEHVWVCHVDNLHMGKNVDREDIEVEVTAKTRGGVRVIRLGVHLGRRVGPNDSSSGLGSMNLQRMRIEHSAAAEEN